MSSAIVGGMLPIACGLAAGGESVWCFIGDMCARTGAFADAGNFAHGHQLPIKFVVEDNGLSTNTPTNKAWAPTGDPATFRVHRRYEYERTTQHYQPLPTQGGF